MSKCEVMLDLDRPEQEYSPGETVTGTVRLRASAACEARRLTLSRQWRTHGRGTRARGGRREIVLDDGPVRLAAGEEREYAFEVVVPGDPCTYRGHYLNIDWYLRARLDVAWARDPRAETEVIVPQPEPGHGPAEASIRPLPVAELPAPVREQLDAAADESDGAGWSAGTASGKRGSLSRLPRPIAWALIGLVGLAMLPVVLGFLFVGTLLVFGGGGTVTRIIGLVLMAGVLFFVGSWVHRRIRRWLAERRLGEVGLKLRSDDVRLGGMVAWFLRFAPKKALEVADVRGTLRVRERVERAVGTDRRTYTHTVAEHDVSLDTPRRIAEGEDMVFTGTIPVPPDAPPSWRVPDNEIRWDLRVRVDLPGWPDWVRTLPVEVDAPEPRAAKAAGG